MKTKLFLCVFGILFGFLYGEFCPDGQSSSCQLTVCGDNFKVECHKQTSPDINVCTCVPTANHQCTLTDAHENADHECAQFGDCHHHGLHWHCVQGTCRCYANHDR